MYVSWHTEGAFIKKIHRKFRGGSCINCVYKNIHLIKQKQINRV